MNPVTEARTQGTHQFTITEYSRIVGLSSPFITRVEQGLYDRIPPKLSNFVATHLSTIRGYTVTDEMVASLYRKFQRDHRSDSGLIFKAAETVPFPCSSTWKKAETRSYFRHWFDELSITRHNFCTMFCVHPSTLDRYLFDDVKSMPGQLVEALEDAHIIIYMEANNAKQGSAA